MAHAEMKITIQDAPEVRALVAELTERAEAAERRAMTEEQLGDLLEHHHHVSSGECSCQSTYDYGPPSMTTGEWIAHVKDQARTRGLV